MMPVLDCQMGVGIPNREYGVPPELLKDPPVKRGGLVKIVLFRFYKKPMTRPKPMLQRTALPESVKFATVSQEVVRRCKNTSRELQPSHINKLSSGSDKPQIWFGFRLMIFDNTHDGRVGEG